MGGREHVFPGNDGGGGLVCYFGWQGHSHSLSVILVFLMAYY